jgi:trehalose 6-phosphate phosphatase
VTPSSPTLPGRPALLLDFDGTLVEIAPTPDAVTVPPDLPGLLERLSRRLDGALAVVSGRPIAQLEALLPAAIAFAGDHGATLRRTPGAALEGAALPGPPPDWLERAAALAAAHPGALLERKAHGFVLHYRQAPSAEAPARALLEELTGGGEDFVLLPARKALEVKPRGVSKGTVVATLMAAPPFAGRLPVFIGDDVTDEAGMAASRAAGGLGLKLQDEFGTPAAFRAWLAAIEAAPPA